MKRQMPDGSYRDLGPRRVDTLRGAAMPTTKGRLTTMRAGRRTTRRATR